MSLIADDTGAIRQRQREITCSHHPHNGIQYCPDCGWRGWAPEFHRPIYYDFETGKPINPSWESAT